MIGRLCLGRKMELLNSMIWVIIFLGAPKIVSILLLYSKLLKIRYIARLKLYMLGFNLWKLWNNGRKLYSYVLIIGIGKDCIFKYTRSHHLNKQNKHNRLFLKNSLRQKYPKMSHKNRNKNSNKNHW